MVNGRRVLNQFRWLVAFFLLGVGFNSWANALEIQVEGLMNNMAILKVNGKQRILNVGRTSPEGIKLLSSNSKQAEVLIAGKKTTLTLSGHISGSYQAPKSASISIRPVHGQYITSGSINSRPAQFLVDTGATSVTLSMEDAQRLGVNLSRSNPVYVNTAGGRVVGHQVVLSQVKVGGLKVSYVDAVVLESGFNGEILLGMSFLKHVKMRDEKGFLVLEQNF
ncbi:retropepsin-like aspartic protease [Litoribacillus peritrichatus]|uniref:TIGR02281 family clan AA aspartic protease n=1 Tax=Litoribacillus peritrichatus TaxID=718191 RepID=A0ABP7LZA8_9GAMM